MCAVSVFYFSKLYKFSMANVIKIFILAMYDFHTDLKGMTLLCSLKRKHSYIKLPTHSLISTL